MHVHVYTVGTIRLFWTNFGIYFDQNAGEILVYATKSQVGERTAESLPATGLIKFHQLLE